MCVSSTGGAFQLCSTDLGAVICVGHPKGKSCQFCPRMPCVGGSGPHNAQAWVCGQVARRVLPTKLGLGAEAWPPHTAHYSLRNVTAARYLGKRVTLRLVECAGVGGGVGMEGG